MVGLKERRMEPLAHTSSRLHRMQGECAEAAGQASVLGMALALLVAVLGLAALLG